MLRSFSHGAREFDGASASVAVACMCDDAAVAAGDLVVVWVEVGRGVVGEVQRPEFAVELLVHVGDREVVLELAPVDDPVNVWDCLIPPPLQRCCSRLLGLRCRKCCRCCNQCSWCAVGAVGVATGAASDDVGGSPTWTKVKTSNKTTKSRGMCCPPPPPPDYHDACCVCT